MYPSFRFGPLSLPTAPFLAILAAVFGLDAAARYGRRLRLHPDDVWNTGLIGLVAGLIVARVWNVFHFWSIYSEELWLIFSIRPSGFEFWPGVVGTLVGGYGYLLWRALDPVRVGAALATGALVGGAIVAISGHLTGDILGMITTVPWALPYFDEQRHPAGLYRALLLLAGWIAIWVWHPPQQTGRTLWLCVLAYSVSVLVADGFVDQVRLVGPFRLSQLAALALALISTAALARAPRATPPLPMAPPVATKLPEPSTQEGEPVAETTPPAA
jgi:phosphatidylglycerol---prolipoprotein diacylglyceryl transferase